MPPDIRDIAKGQLKVDKIRGKITPTIGTPFYTGSFVLVDDTVALVDDTVAVSGGPFTYDLKPEGKIKKEIIKGKIKEDLPSFKIKKDFISGK